VKTPTHIHDAAAAYRQTGIDSGAECTNSHGIVLLLLEGAIQQINSARNHLAFKGSVAEKGGHIGVALEIIGVLRGSLDMEQGGDIAQNLDALYDYMQRRLLESNLHNDVDGLDEVARLLRTIRSGWQGIAPAPQP